MKQYKILIADDEYLAREAIKLCLPADTAVNIVAECNDGISALAAIRQHLPDIVFLDIQMPGLTGFEVLRSLPANYNPYLIIVTAHDDFALTAYEHSASDYLVKPFSDERFSKAYQKAIMQCSQNRALSAIQSLTERMQVLLQNKTYKSRISIKDGTKIFVVPCEEILFIAATGDYTTVHTLQRKYLHGESLTNLENGLDSNTFVRIHRSCIVNTKFIKELESHYNGDYTVVLLNGHALKLSRNYREQLLRAIG